MFKVFSLRRRSQGFGDWFMVLSRLMTLRSSHASPEVPSPCVGLFNTVPSIGSLPATAIPEDESKLKGSHCLSLCAHLTVTLRHSTSFLKSSGASCSRGTRPCKGESGGASVFGQHKTDRRFDRHEAVPLSNFHGFKFRRRSREEV